MPRERIQWYLHGETVNGAPVYESFHKDRSNKGVFLIYKANDGQSGHEWIITRNRDDISKDAGSYRACRLRSLRIKNNAGTPSFCMMGVTSRWEKCSELHVAEGKLIVSLCLSVRMSYFMSDEHVFLRFL